MIRAAFFDIGRTLVDDPFPKAKYTVGKFLAQKGILKSSSLDAFLETLTLANARIDSYQFSHFWGEEEIFTCALSNYGIYDNRLVKQALAVYRQEVKRLYKTDPSLKALSNKELVSLLSWLHDEKGLLLGVISDERIASTALYWDVLECGDFFPLVVTSEEVGCRKPCKRIFRYALEVAKVTAEESFYVGDNQFRDVVGAKSVGMMSILFTKFCDHSIKVRPDFTIDNLQDLRPIVVALTTSPHDGELDTKE
jgi:HAD superfamily hydrolase (TIGR01549 family)